MAGPHDKKLEPIEVPGRLRMIGDRFIIWPKSEVDDSIVPTPVTLKIDPKGYIVYWQEPNKDTESLEISSIRDTRIGKYARVPKSERWEKVLQIMDPQIREVAGNTNIPLESKCLTIVSGMKFSEPQFINFIAVGKKPLAVVKMWADFLFESAHHPLTADMSVERSIEKIYSKMIYETNQLGKVPVKKCIKMLGGNHGRTTNAFHSVGLTSKGKKDETVEPSEFPLIAFKKVLQLICQRPELDKVFSHLGGKVYLSLEQTKRFINTIQRDSRLNEVPHPFLTDEQVRTLIEKYEPNVMLAKRSQLSVEGLDAYLQSDENMPVSSTKYDLCQDMNQPLSHYFINSSHNTYLTGNQYRSRSSAEMYRQCLLAGCRCVELDCWDSGGQVEPNITHGFTLCSEVSVKEVIEAIDESAFKTSPYPVILSFENHVDSPQNQAKMAQYCRDIFGDKLLIDPLPQYPLEPGVPLPSPKNLIGKIIVKNKKLKPGDKKSQGKEKELLHQAKSFDSSAAEFERMAPGTLPKTKPTPHKRKGSAPTSTDLTQFTIKEECDDVIKESNSEQTNVDVSENEAKSESKDEEDWDDEEEEEFDVNQMGSGTASKESKAHEAMSSLVNYIQPVRFESFEHAEKRKRSFEISSLTENGALRLLTYYPIEIVNYNKRQLSRIYPKGARVDSSNYNPQLFWNAGCQLVALNFQTLCSSMQLNLSLFEFNNNCGYLLKPQHMRRVDRQFNPFAQCTIDGVVAAALSIKVISGQFLSTSRVSTCVEVDMTGLVADTVRRRFKTNTVQNNGTNPHYNSDAFLFPKVVLPSLATICFSVKEANGNCIGQRYLPVESLRPGYRYITLRNEGNQPLNMLSIFVYIEVKDYIPEKLEMIAAMLANPIEHLEKRKKEEKAINDRWKAINILLDEDEKKEIPSLQQNGEVKEKILVTPFTPAGIEALQKCKEHQGLHKKTEKKIAEFLKKQREEYDDVFSAYFEKRKRSSTIFWRKFNVKKMNLPFDMNTALPSEAKKEHMLILIQRHLENERVARQEINDDFMKDFSDVVRKEQQKEIKQLEKLAEKEEQDLQAKKKVERDEKVRGIPKNLPKEDLEAKKHEIDQKYVEQTVREVRSLMDLQEKRLTEVRKQQKDIVAQLSDVERQRGDNIVQIFKQQSDKVSHIFDIRQAEYYQKRGHGTINSLTYSHDGTNDDMHVGRTTARHLQVYECEISRRSSTGKLRSGTQS